MGSSDSNFDLTEMKKTLPMTENRNSFTMDIDELDTVGILRKINQEDQKVAKAVEEELENIAAGVDIITEAFRNGGRLIYIGAGTSGRLGILDASECPPTYGVQKGMVIGLIAGGRKAIEEPVEGAEDTPSFAVEDLKEINFSKKDVLTGIAACGKTPYVIGGLEYAKSIGAKTIAIACSKNSQIGNIADVKIEVIVGPEVVTGSTRMKAGTAQKLVLNMLTTSSMIKLGKVYGNLMIDVQAWNKKLVERSKRIWMECTDGSYDEACKFLHETKFNVKEAILMKLADIGHEEAKNRLKAANGHFKTALKMGFSCNC
uniref:SIS domain-containing protein n=1 Tax=Panagrolaimus sp. PS1159 TaxID=55785 RepID=A0AC35F8T9_9BILA